MKAFRRNKRPVVAAIVRYIHAGRAAGNEFVLIDEFHAASIAMRWSLGVLPSSAKIIRDNAVAGGVFIVGKIAAYNNISTVRITSY